MIIREGGGDLYSNWFSDFSIALNTVLFRATPES